MWRAAILIPKVMQRYIHFSVDNMFCVLVVEGQ